MQIEKLDKHNFKQYMDYLREAMSQEPDMMTIEEIDEEGLEKRINEDNGRSCVSLLAIRENKVIGRIEYHFYSCFQGGQNMAYVSWVYVLGADRHMGVAQQLFRAFEEDCRNNDIHQYYLIQAANENARRFYGSFQNASSSAEMILRKNVDWKS